MAVYTDVTFEDLEELLAGYDIGAPLSFKGIAEGVENTNFYLQTDRGSYFLTLYEKRVQESDLPFFLGLMEHLAARGIACPAAGAAQGRRAVDARQRPSGGARQLSDRPVPAAARRRRIARRPAMRWRGCTRRARTLRSQRPNALGVGGLARTRRQDGERRRRHRTRACAS